MVNLPIGISIKKIFFLIGMRYCSQKKILRSKGATQGKLFQKNSTPPPGHYFLGVPVNIWFSRLNSPSVVSKNCRNEVDQLHSVCFPEEF
jgi:hypothetical protein